MKDINRKIKKSDLMLLCRKYMRDLEVEKESRARYDRVLSRIIKERNELNDKIEGYDNAVQELNGLLNCILHSLMVQLKVDTLEIDRINYEDFKAMNKTIVAKIDDENNKIILEMKEVDLSEYEQVQSKEN